MTGDSLQDAARVARSFVIESELLEVLPHHRGHIHDTFVSRWDTPGGERRYLHQRLNEEVFTDIPGLMHNIDTVTRHLRDGASAVAEPSGLQTLRLVPTRDGQTYLRSASGAWRTYHYLDGTESFDRCDSEERAYQAALAFGAFQARLADLDPAQLVETIPDFFSTPVRFEQLDQARNADSAGRVAGAAVEVEFVEARRRLSEVVEQPLRSGAMPRRIVHGDTKLNNVLFDRRSGKAVCVIDLDTCMPAYSLYDFGDLVRFTAATSAEDATSLDAAGIDLDLYAALARGYLESAGRFLTAGEVALMPLAAQLVTLTVGVRFLTDHLAGDVYFKTDRNGHNLDRARVQFKMVEAMEQSAAEMQAAT